MCSYPLPESQTTGILCVSVWTWEIVGVCVRYPLATPSAPRPRVYDS